MNTQPVQESMNANITSAKGPHILSDETASSLEQPLSREEVRQRAKQLNSGSGSQGEGTFSILPHPATDNDPNSLNQGLTGDPVADATKARPPHIVSAEQNLEEPLSREELRIRADELNA